MIEFIKAFLVFCTPFAAKAGVITTSGRRILAGHEVGETRPYMVYLRAAATGSPAFDDSWLCGGVIVHERYVLTSAACIEDVNQFYIVSGTYNWVSSKDEDNECIKNGAKKAVWKCVPKSYFYDGNEFDNISWMANDIAVVKVEDDFNFERRVKGCDFIPKKIPFNNRSADLEKSGLVGSIAGWGSTDSFGDIILRATQNSPVLLETEVVLLSKKNCKKRWHKRYHNIIDDTMICAKDGMDSHAMTLACSEQEVNCKELVYSDEEEEADLTRRMVVDPDDLNVHSGFYNHTRRSKVISGGFCENDHGGPLIIGQGSTAMVIGVISACQTHDFTKKCYGPFLYTSVWKNRYLLSCAIDKDINAPTCRRLLKTMKTQITETTFDWKSHADGQAQGDKLKPKTDIPSIIKAKTLKKST